VRHSLTRLRAKRRPSSRRAGFPSARRLALVAIFGVCLLGHSTALADGSSPIVVATVYAAGKSPTTDSVSLASLQSNSQRCPQYPGTSMEELGRNPPAQNVPLPPSGTQTGTWGLGTILSCLETPIPLATVTGVTVIAGDGAPEEGPNSQLTRPDLASPSDFENTAEVPVIEDDGSLIQYDRPSRNSTDPNRLDEVQGSANGQAQPIQINVFEGPALTVTATASQTTVAAGGTVSFTATVSPGDQPGLAYSWNFDGGAPDSQSPNPQVKFAAGGQFEVTLEVTDPAGGGGGATISIAVTSATPPPANPNGPSKGPTHSSGTTSGGRTGNQTGQGGSAGGHGSGTASGGTGPTGSGGAGSAAPGGRASSGNGAPSAQPSQPGTPAANDSGPGSSQSQPRGASHTRAHDHGANSNAGRPPSASGANPLTAPVSGLLISDVTPVAPGASSLVRVIRAPPATAPAIRTPTSASPWPILGASLAVLLLLGLGAGRELRGRRRWRPLRLGG
jgi:PKD domain-containing protein